MKPSVVALIPISATDFDFDPGGMPQLEGRPLVEYTIRAAQNSELLDRIVVSTDSQTIAAQCRRYDVDVPFLRPPELANPTAPVTEVLHHAVQWLEVQEGFIPDWVVMLLITHPFRPPGFIDQFIEAVLSQDLDSAFAAVEERYSHWHVRENSPPELVSFGDDTAKVHKRPFFRALGGLISMATRQVVMGGSLYGDRLGIIRTESVWSIVDVHDPIGKELADLLAPNFVLGDQTY